MAIAPTPARFDIDDVIALFAQPTIQADWNGARAYVFNFRIGLHDPVDPDPEELKVHLARMLDSAIEHWKAERGGWVHMKKVHGR